MTTSDTHSSKGAAVSGTASIDGISCGALALLLQAFAYAHGRGERWVCLEIDRLYEAGLTISDLRWLVAKEFAEHGQECSVQGSPHRSYRRRAASASIIRPVWSSRPGVPHSSPRSSKHRLYPCNPFRHRDRVPCRGRERGGRRRAPRARWTQAYNPWHIKTVLELNAARADSAWRVVKHYRVPANNQERILSAFEEVGWPDSIDDPLPVRHDVDPRTRLHDAINRLNGCQINRLLRFHGNGAGTGVSWELRETRTGGSLTSNRGPGRGLGPCRPRRESRVESRKLTTSPRQGSRPNPSTPDRHLPPSCRRE